MNLNNELHEPAHRPTSLVLCEDDKFIPLLLQEQAVQTNPILDQATHLLELKWSWAVLEGIGRRRKMLGPDAYDKQLYAETLGDLCERFQAARVLDSKLQVFYFSTETLVTLEIEHQRYYCFIPYSWEGKGDIRGIHVDPWWIERYEY